MLAFITSPLGKALMIVLAVFAFYSWAFNRGETKAEARCQTKALQAKIEALELDLAAARSGEDAAKAARDRQAATAVELSKKVDDYEAELEKRPDGDACRLTDDDARWLRSIAD